MSLTINLLKNIINKKKLLNNKSAFTKIINKNRNSTYEM